MSDKREDIINNLKNLGLSMCHGTTSGVDHDKEIPANERMSGDYAMAMLCKQDKEQLDRIEKKLDKLINIVDVYK